jgi:F-type H+-transporting ATPase subunit epsilon
MFALQILSPTGEVFSDSVEEVLLPTPNGEISVLAYHIPLFSKLAEGTLTIKKGGKNTLIAILGGFLEVKENIVTILSDYAVKAESIQAAQALEAKKMAEEIIAKKESTAELITAEKNLQKSLLELKVANKLKRHP